MSMATFPLSFTSLLLSHLTSTSSFPLPAPPPPSLFARSSIGTITVLTHVVLAVQTVSMCAYVKMLSQIVLLLALPLDALRHEVGVKRPALLCLV